MRRVIVVLWVILMSALILKSQETDNVKYIAELLAKEPEELSEEEILQFTDLLRKPVRLNIASQNQLLECGLFTRYQVASLSDYKERSGQILSFLELSNVDGFGEELVSKLQPFISLEQTRQYEGRLGHEITVRTSLKSTSDNDRYSYAARYKVNYGDRFNVSAAFSRSLDAKAGGPDAYCASVGIRFRRVPAKVVFGDFNARFGQGLALWSGTQFSSLNDPSTFLRRSSGLSTTSSFTGTDMLTGVAAELSIKRLTVSVVAGSRGLKTIVSKPDKFELLPALNLNHTWRHGQIGFTQVSLNKTSFDLSACFRGVDLFSELIYDWKVGKPAGLAGVVFPVGDMTRIATILRSVYPEHLLAASCSISDRKIVSGTLSSEVTLYSEPKVNIQDRSLQVKLHTQWQFVLSEYFVIKCRMTERIRSWGDSFRTDIRSDLLWQSSLFNATLRLNLLNCVNTSFLTYIEGGLKTEKFYVYLRQGLFLVDDWNDRIYAYERDVPGCYNSPAFYGRGVWTSLMASWKASRSWRLYWRAGYTAFPFMKEKKPGKAELRFQTVFDF